MNRDMNLVVGGRYLFKCVRGLTYLFDAVVVELTDKAIRFRFNNDVEDWWLKKDFYSEHEIVEVLYEPMEKKGTIVSMDLNGAPVVYFGRYPVCCSNSWFVRSS